MKNYLLFVFAIIIYQSSQAQNLTDVVRWSAIDQLGTARTLGAGSAFGAMGGDFSVVNINPAGIADYRVSEFTFTPSLRGYKTDAWFDKNSVNNQLSKGTGISLDNIGFIIASNPGSKWTSSNVVLGFSRTADLGRKVLIEGKIPGSIATYFAEKANGYTVDELDDFIAYPAYNTGAIYDADKDNNYETDFGSADQQVDRTQEITQKGGINELTVGWAGEYNNQLNMGLSVGVPFGSFEEEKVYRESDDGDFIPVFNELKYTERLNTSGVGINFKAGFTYKILNNIRIGGAFHSPTWYKFSDDYSTALEYAFTDHQGYQQYDYTSPDGTFEYKISTPWRAIGSAGYIYRIGDIRGFINADIEHLDYTNANYNGTAYSSDAGEIEYTNEVNRTILKKLGTATNVRLGTEFGYKNLRVRGGYSFEQSPYNADTHTNNKISFGLGFREDNFFIDLGFRIAENVEGYNPYVVIDSDFDPLANIKTTRTRSALTVGFKF